jgi:choline dehydrogenase-like flavoprotein
MSQTSTPGADRFDYIVVGSGAGGAPLAARLARAGCKVLVLEAGSDHVEQGGEGREATLVPSLHGFSTEHEDLAWKFFVKHYANPSERDPKCHPKEGGNPPPEDIFYPRAAALGGCTVHNALITVAGPDSDWEDLADFVKDDSWRGGAMRAYFERLERNEYHRPPLSSQPRWWRRLRDHVRWLFGFRPDRTRGRHGFDGWLHTSVTDISLGLRDKLLIKMLTGALWQARRAGLERGWTLVRRFLKGRITQVLDPNHSLTQAESPEGVVLVPLAVNGPRTTIHQNSETPFVMRGRRSSPREFLLETRKTHPENLEIWTNVLVTGVLFDDGEPPRAVGVSFLRGERLYRAHEKPSDKPGEPGQVFVRPRGEVILAGGAFNTPQLLMLSGLGSADELSKLASTEKRPDGCVLRGPDGKPLQDGSGHYRRIDLPGVGLNLQDRYEVTVISQMKGDFSLLEGATFKPPRTGQPDRHLKQWRDTGTGLYTSNGSVLGILKRSNPDLEQPDLFIFGLPLPFRGYDLGYSDVGHIHNQFTWAILKGHTRNSDGVVRLRSLDPRAVPDINFHYFNETTCEGKGDLDPDLEALVHGVKFVRGIADWANWPFKRAIEKEVHPCRTKVPVDDDAAIRNWIRREAWGHHACGTCRMGPDGDPRAVLDSRFRVQKVDGLRVVDASIFPRIPGYFIVTNIYMASEKAADVILADRRTAQADRYAYPHALREREAAALEARRRALEPPRRNPHEQDPEEQNEEAPLFPRPIKPEDTWPDDVTGLALSGGGVRSATFNLGVLQTLASCRLLRRVDVLSTVSGGGYIGAFVGRWFDRLRPQAEWGGEARRPVEHAADQVERGLTDPDSKEVGWLRKHGNYIAPSGAGDRQVNTAIFIRSFLSVHFVVGLLLFTIFGIGVAIRYGLDTTSAALAIAGINTTGLPLGRLLKGTLGIFFSPWFFAFEAVVLLLVLPRIIGYWIVSQRRHGRFEWTALLALFVLAGAILFAGVRNGLNVPAVLFGLSLLLAFGHVEVAWHRGRVREDAIGRGSVETQRLRTRNQLTSDLGLALVLAAGAFVFALVDSIGHALQQRAAGNAVYAAAFASFFAALMALAPMVRLIANLFANDKKKTTGSALPRPSREQIMAGVLAAVLFTLPLVFVSFAAHGAFDGGRAFRDGLAITALAFFLSVIFALPAALTFINRSSLAQVYAARLARAYLGATNPVRRRPYAANVTEVVAGDDVGSIRDYKPYMTGGPLHLINMTVNQTVDFSSQRGNRDRKGEILTVSPIGMTIGEQWHASWEEPAADEAEGGRQPAVRLVPLGYQRGTGHPLVDEMETPTKEPEMLSLREWIAISGAAVGPGRGQTTQLGTALLYGLANLRTGYWWDSGISQFARAGFPHLTAFRRFGYLLAFYFQSQTLLLSEWVARFPGPWDRFWYLSDGGFFETTGAYELIRRRVPRIIVCDASADPTYEMDSFANLMRKVRIDLDADIRAVPAGELAGLGIPEGIAERLGTLDELRPRFNGDGALDAYASKDAALFWVWYGTEPRRRSVLLYLKSTLTGDEPGDITHYQRTHRQFPHEPTSDQSFDEAQWESYRALGEHRMRKLCLLDDPWFWKIPLV